MRSSVTRNMIESLFPEGSIWIPKIGGELDLFLDGVSENLEIVRIYLESFSTVRNPQKTIYLSDLEKEYGLVNDGNLSDSDRRLRLSSAKTSNNGDGTDLFLEQKLREAGFDLFVYRNNPIVDPKTILDDGYIVFCGDAAAYCGGSDVVCGKSSGLLVVNGYEIAETYTVPLDSSYWQFVFFVGGYATLNVSKQIVSIEPAQVPISRKEELKRLITRYKPLHSWCSLIVEFTQNITEPPPPNNGGDIIYQ